jgi:hypothetical protein
MKIRKSQSPTLKITTGPGWQAAQGAAEPANASMLSPERRIFRAAVLPVFTVFFVVALATVLLAFLPQSPFTRRHLEVMLAVSAIAAAELLTAGGGEDLDLLRPSPPPLDGPGGSPDVSVPENDLPAICPRRRPFAPGAHFPAARRGVPSPADRPAARGQSGLEKVGKRLTAKFEFR